MRDSTAPAGGRAVRNGGTIVACRLFVSRRYPIAPRIQGIPRQQTMVDRKLSIILIRSRTNQMEDLLPLAPKIIKALESIQPGQSVLVPLTG